MDSIKFFSKSFFKFLMILIGILIINILFLILLLINTYSVSDSDIKITELNRAFNISSNNTISGFSKKQESILNKHDVWAMILDDNGNIVDEYKLPKNLNKKYNSKDIVGFTRWYLDDYPVFTYIQGDHILVFGFPIGSFDKFPFNYYNFSTYKYILVGILSIIVANLILILFIYLYSKKKLFKEISPIIEGLESISNNKKTKILESGNLVDIKKSINNTSNILENNKVEGERWIRGISHDIRTPLTVILGNTEYLKNKYDEEKLQIIKDNSLLIQDIISDLNLSYSLNLNNEVEKDYLDLSKILRKTLINIMNSIENCNIDLNIQKSNYNYPCNEVLMERLFRNIVLNSIKHNVDPIIKIIMKKEDNSISISIEDNGNITKEKIDELNKYTDYNNNGFGILISKKITELHNGKINFQYNDPGLKTDIIFKI